MSLKFGFWLNAGFAALNLALFFFTPFDFASPLCLGVGIFNAYTAYTLRSYA